MKRKRTIRGFHYWFIASIFLLLTFLGGFFLYQQELLFVAQKFSPAFSQLKTWMIAHKPREIIAKSKRIINEQQDNAEPIRFEFYTALPNIRMDISQEGVEAMPINKQALTKSVVDAKELEQSVLAAIKQKQYIVLLKTFHSSTVAMRYHQLLMNANFKAKIIKISLSEKSTIYRVQLGPFSNQDQANEMLLRLQKAGYDGIIQERDVISGDNLL